MQTIWKGTVSFGLVSIPVRLYAATEERNVSFRQVHEADGGRIRYKRVCDIDGEEVPYREIAKGYEMPDGEVVILQKEDFESLPLPSNRIIDVLQFIPTDQLDALMLARAYYLSADGPGAKPYVLLRDALERTGRVAIVKVALRNREQLAALTARGDVLVLQTMLWPDEVRDAGGLAPAEGITVRDQEVAMAESYIETLTGDFDAEEYTDEYRHALEELINAKAGGRAVEGPEEPGAQESNVVDLMAALRASVEAAKARRGQAAAAPETATDETGRTDEVEEAEDTDTSEDGTSGDESRTATRRASTTRTGARKSTAGRATAKRTPAKKAPAARKAAEKTTSSRRATSKAAAEEAAEDEGAGGKAAGTGSAGGSSTGSKRAAASSAGKDERKQAPARKAARKSA
jgi:DNA end-binding protein Ku